MPTIKSGYLPKNPLFRNKHFATIFPTQFRTIQLTHPLERLRLNTPDLDFIDVDVSFNNHTRAAILLHGFEGNSERPYMLGMSRQLQKDGWDIIAVNHRGCSGEPNKTPRAYHAGETEDLALIIEHMIQARQYKEVVLVGFSLGGNILLNYLGKQTNIPPEVKAGVAISVPVDLRTAAFEIMKPSNWVYHRDFFKKVMQKMKIKEKKYPQILPFREIYSSRNIDDIDENYTAPFHGFRDATDYREKSSALFVLDRIQRPALLLNSQDDPFLTASNYPYDIASTSADLFLLTPRYGGHCGFWMRGNTYYHEIKASEFVKQYSRF